MTATKQSMADALVKVLKKRDTKVRQQRKKNGRFKASPPKK